MNERIREIAKQAYIADASKLPNWKFKPETEFLLKQLEGFNEKFADLIIKECIQVLLDRKYDNPYDSGTMLVNQGLQTGVEILSAKFGVKE